MNRRNFIQVGATGAAAVAITSQIGCGGKSVSGTVQIISGSISELQILFPGQTTLDKVVKLASDFNADWVAGNFDSARTLFENLDKEVGQVISDLGINASTRVKLLLATLGIALRTIAALIQEQGSASPVIAATARSAASRTVDRVTELADPATADKLLKTLRP